MRRVKPVTEPNTPVNDIVLPVIEQDRTARLIRVWIILCSMNVKDSFQQLMKNNNMLLGKEYIKMYSI